MESISFAPNSNAENSNAENIYWRVIGNTETAVGKKMVDILFHSVATLDSNTILSKEEAQKVEDALNKYDKGKLLSLGINYRSYDNQEIMKTWASPDGMGSPLFQESFAYLAGFKNKFAIGFIHRFLPLFLTYESEASRQILTYYQKLANHPKVRLKNLILFSKEIADLYLKTSPYARNKGEVDPQFDVPGFNFEAYIKYMCIGLRRSAKLVFDRFIFVHDLKPQFDKNSSDVEYLIKASKSENRLLSAKALLKLGEMRKKRDVIINAIEQEKSLLPIIYAFEGLSHFRDEETVDYLLDKVTRCSFESRSYVKGALVHYAAPKIVIKRLCAMLDSKDSFRRGEAASFLKYFINKPEFAVFRKRIRHKLLRVSRNKHECPFIRATARETLKCLKDKKAPTFNLSDDLYREVIIHSTFFFRYPKQLQWIIEKVRERAKEIQHTNQKIQVLSVGSSIGAEPISVLMAVLEDYEANPEAWGDFDVRTRFKVISTDVDLDALRYQKRGIYHKSRELNLNEMLGFHKYSKVYGADENELLDKYFDDEGEQKYKFKDEYCDMLEIRKMDIVFGDKSLNNQAYIVLYNNVAAYLGSKHSKAEAVKELCKLSQKYISYVVDPKDRGTLTMFGLLTKQILKTKSLSFAEKIKDFPYFR